MSNINLITIALALSSADFRFWQKRLQPTIARESVFATPNFQLNSNNEHTLTLKPGPAEKLLVLLAQQLETAKQAKTQPGLAGLDLATISDQETMQLQSIVTRLAITLATYYQNIPIGNTQQSILPSKRNLPLIYYFPIDIRTHFWYPRQVTFRFAPARLFMLAELLAVPEGQQVEQDKIIDACYGRHGVTPGTFHTQMSYLRGETSPFISIFTERNKGYTVKVNEECWIGQGPMATAQPSPLQPQLAQQQPDPILAG